MEPSFLATNYAPISSCAFMGVHSLLIFMSFPLVVWTLFLVSSVLNNWDLSSRIMMPWRWCSSMPVTLSLFERKLLQFPRMFHITRSNASSKPILPLLSTISPLHPIIFFLPRLLSDTRYPTSKSFLTNTLPFSKNLHFFPHPGTWPTKYTFCETSNLWMCAHTIILIFRKGRSRNKLWKCYPLV